MGLKKGLVGEIVLILPKGQEKFAARVVAFNGNLHRKSRSYLCMVLAKLWQGSASREREGEGRGPGGAREEVNSIRLNALVAAMCRSANPSERVFRIALAEEAANARPVRSCEQEGAPTNAVVID